ncbi:hypothetical protein [Nostoc sp.]|uniref:hypothetical protein n=1 Tax=Nostoc sp. TaxID=1180 RepID=UPI002FFBA522
MVEVNVNVLFTGEDFSSVADRWKGNFPTVPRVGDFLAKYTRDDVTTYKVVAIAMADGVPEPIVFCIIDSLQAYS